MASIMGHDDERLNMIIRIFQFLAVCIVVVIVAGGILLSIRPDLAPVLRDAIQVATGPSSDTAKNPNGNRRRH